MKRLENQQTMSSLDLICSTDTPETSSGGVSLANYIGRCDPIPHDFDTLESTEPDHEAAHWFRFPLCEQAHGMQAYVDVCVPSESEVHLLSDTEAYRLFCHIIVQRLPACAFEEAVESLCQMFEFYRDSPRALPASSALPSVKAKITGRHTVPVYPITEE